MATDHPYRQLGIRPATNPAILSSATWEPERAWEAIAHIGDNWRLALAALRTGEDWSASRGVSVLHATSVHRGGAVLCIADLPDGQQVVLELGHGGASHALGTPLGTARLSDGLGISAYPTDAAVLDRYFRLVAPSKGPRPLGAKPRLGIGCRMTTAVWPGMFKAMRAHGFAANPIQNSVRELSLLDDMMAGRPPERNYACGFGMIESGYTGSTYEGLWVSGVLAALREEAVLSYGADADHLQVKRGADGRARTRHLIEASRHYTFFTLDLSDVLHYDALTASRDTRVLEDAVPDVSERRAIMAVHSAPFKANGTTLRPSLEMLDRFAAKYWEALSVFEELVDDISGLKGGQGFDLEFTIDEHPPEVDAFACLTSPEELLFLLREIERRGLPVTHVAPNYGAEKGWDYRGTDGVAGLKQRVTTLHAVASNFQVMLDFHSADDLSQTVRQALGRATGGWLHYKISPMLQLLFADVLKEYHNDLFLRWWEDSLAYARREAEGGSSFAAECLRAYEESDDREPSRYHPVFHHYGFAFVGRRASDGRLANREQFYTLSGSFYRAYEEVVAEHLSMLATDLFER